MTSLTIMIILMMLMTGVPKEWLFSIQSYHRRISHQKSIDVTLIIFETQDLMDLGDHRHLSISCSFTFFSTYNRCYKRCFLFSSVGQKRYSDVKIRIINGRMSRVPFPESGRWWWCHVSGVMGWLVQDTSGIPISFYLSPQQQSINTSGQTCLTPFLVFGAERWLSYKFGWSNEKWKSMPEVFDFPIITFIMIHAIIIIIIIIICGIWVCFFESLGFRISQMNSSGYDLRIKQWMI